MKRAFGYALWVLSLAAWGAIAVLPLLNISVGSAAAVTTALLIFGEVAFFAGAAILGPEAWARVKSFFKRK